MATDKEYKAVIDALSGECERLHKENEELKKALENHDTFMKYAYSQGKQDALSQEPCEDCISRQAVLDGLASIAKAKAKSDGQKSLMGRVMSFTEHLPSVTPKFIECDAISREEVLYLIADDDLSMGQVVKGIHALPSVTQTPKYWIDKDNKIYKMPDDIPTMTIQYPTITHEDTISRTEVMKVISDFVTLEKYIDKHNHITFEPLEQMINSLPSVTQKGDVKNV